MHIYWVVPVSCRLTIHSSAKRSGHEIQAPEPRLVRCLRQQLYHDLESYMSSCTTRAILFYYIDKHGIFGVSCVVKQLPVSFFNHYSKTFSHFFFTTNGIWSDILLVEEYTVFVYVINKYIYIYITRTQMASEGYHVYWFVVACVLQSRKIFNFTTI